VNLNTQWVGVPNNSDRRNSVYDSIPGLSWAANRFVETSEGDDLDTLFFINALHSASSSAWARMESLLYDEWHQYVDQRTAALQLVDRAVLSQDVNDIFQRALDAHTQGISPSDFSLDMSDPIGGLRQEYAAIEPRLIGFLSTYCFYTARYLMDGLPPTIRPLMAEYFDVIFDNLCIPIKRAYDAAGQHAFNSPQLQVVRRLIPASRSISQQVVENALRIYPNYRSVHGNLSDPAIRSSSIRDVETFQTYLWVCILEGSLAPVEQELLPLCQMLYPRLQVSGELVRQLIHLLGVTVRLYLSPDELTYFQPQYKALWLLFSPDRFDRL
jgi:hypothetical protein